MPFSSLSKTLLCRQAGALIAAVLLAGSQAGSAPLEPDGPVVYLIGDSTMAATSKDGANPGRGWGQLLPEYFKDSVRISNRAKGGRSSLSFREEGLWSPVLEALKPGDWVILQFGHNDQKKDKPLAYADPVTAFPELIGKFLDEAREKGAHPILLTPIYRRYFSEEGRLRSTAGAYPEAARKVAKERGVPLVDLHASSGRLIEQYGVEGSKVLFLHFPPGENAFFPAGKADNSHLSETGARLIAGLFAQALREQQISLGKYLKE
jgi:DNA sulfur modification protein DndE